MGVFPRDYGTALKFLAAVLQYIVDLYLGTHKYVHAHVHKRARTYSIVL